jgi:nucleotide-binding universal stress UspA family protein
VKLKTIVSVLDSSTGAKDAALTQAVSLARWYDADLHVVHGGTSVREIARQVTPIAPDLVVVTKDMRGSSGHWSPGSFAAALGKAVTTPTIVIPSHPAHAAEQGGPFKNILAAVDFSDASLQALSAALTLAQESGGLLKVLHVLRGFPYETVYSGSRAYRLLDQFEAHVTRVNRELQALIPPDARNWSEIGVATISGRPHQGILAAAAERPTDLVVLGLSQRPQLEGLIAGSTVRRVLRRATSPVLLVPGPSKATRFSPPDQYAAQFTRDTSAQGVASWG